MHDTTADMLSLLTTAEVSDILRLSSRSVRRLVLSGDLAVVQVGAHSPRITRSSLLAFIESRSTSRRS